MSMRIKQLSSGEQKIIINALHIAVMSWLRDEDSCRESIQHGMPKEKAERVAESFKAAQLAGQTLIDKIEGAVGFDLALVKGE